MSGLVGPTGAPLSQRKVREVAARHQEALVTLTQAFSLFLRLGFFGRLGWLLFGARAFGPKPPTPPVAQRVGGE